MFSFGVLCKYLLCLLRVWWVVWFGSGEVLMELCVVVGVMEFGWVWGLIGCSCC